MTKALKEFIRISPGFKAAVNLRKERDNLAKVAGYIPTEVAREIILDFAKKLHPTTPDLRSRIIMGTYGTGKSHLALVLLNFFLRPLDRQELQLIVDKLDLDTKAVLKQYRQMVPMSYLTVTLYGDEGNIGDSLMMGLRRALDAENLQEVLPATAYDAAIRRIEDFEEKYQDSFEILRQKISEKGKTVEELKTRLREYQRNAFDLFREVYPDATSGSVFSYDEMLDPVSFYEAVCAELIKHYGYSGIVVFWDEFGHKMEEVVKDPTGKEGLTLQNFAECCNSSSENQLHLYLFCHRSLKEYHDISRSVSSFSHLRLEDDLRKIEGRFKQYTLKSTDAETFQLINGVVVADEQSLGWKHLKTSFIDFFSILIQTTTKLNYFTGFSAEEVERIAVFGAYPLHPMAVFSLPAVSEKVAQNNRTLFTCLCEDEPGSFRRFLDKAVVDPQASSPPIFTVDQLWDYFSRDIKQQERTYSIFRDFEQLKTRLTPEDELGLRILKVISIFRVFNPSRFKVNDDILFYSLNISPDNRTQFFKDLALYADLKNENHILMRLQSDGSFRPAVSSSTESLMEKVRKIIEENPEKLGQKPIPYLKSMWSKLALPESIEATGYGDDYGVYRCLLIEPISMYQLRERLHILTKNLCNEKFDDGLIIILLCETSSEIEEAKSIANTILTEKQYQQVVIAIPKNPVQIARLLLEHQALSYLKQNEASLYAMGGELYEEWRVWQEDKNSQLMDAINSIVNPKEQRLDYYWNGRKFEIVNNIQLKNLATKVMLEVFPYCPHIGEQKLARDDFGGNWGYRNECRDIVLKLNRSDAAEMLWRETGAAPKHVINLLLKANGFLQKNQAGEIIIAQPDKDDYPGSYQIFVIINEYIRKARQSPVEMKNLVTRLRKPPFGLKRRSMPIFFAAVAHNELALGNVSFEFQRTAQHYETISTLEADTLEKIFANPDRYKLVYVNVSSNQKAVIEGMANVFNVSVTQAEPPLEKVKKVGTAIGAWWRSLPKYAHITENVSDDSTLVGEHIFRPLAELEPDSQSILLKDAFIHVFDTGKKVKQKDVEHLFGGIKAEFEDTLKKLKERILNEYIKLFAGKEGDDLMKRVNEWFAAQSDDTKNYVHHGDPAIVISCFRSHDAIYEDGLFYLAERITGLSINSWADEMVLKFSARLESAKSYIESFKPPTPTTTPAPIMPIKENHVGLHISLPNGEHKKRVFEVNDMLSPNGQALENMLNTTIEQIGKGLDKKEISVILYRFLNKHLF